MGCILTVIPIQLSIPNISFKSVVTGQTIYINTRDCTTSVDQLKTKWYHKLLFK